MAIVSAFLGREILAVTLGTITGIVGADDTILRLVEQAQASALPLGSGLAAGILYHCSAVRFHCYPSQRSQLVEIGAAHGDRLPALG